MTEATYLTHQHSCFMIQITSMIITTHHITGIAHSQLAYSSYVFMVTAYYTVQIDIPQN